MDVRNIDGKTLLVYAFAYGKPTLVSHLLWRSRIWNDYISITFCYGDPEYGKTILASHFVIAIQNMERLH